MKSPSRVVPLVLIGLIAALTLTAAGGDKAAKVWAAEEIQWTENAAVKGFWIAPLWGDPSKGAYGALKKVAGGTELGWHTHTHAQKVVAVSGTIGFTLEGESAKDLTAGSYVYLPAKTKHHTVCKTGADCIFFEEQPGKTDVIPAK
ncbi:MAG TPA: cupin domain-containing protein [Thermoanaerobaculia bacterium]|nr:cupin domain-containing protein [Thermoanaerobaculia bacterium]